jgi:hypothetical protein
MTQSPEGILASDADRDEAASALADAVASGRLSLADHNARLDALFAARTQDQVAAVTADLPALPARRGALYRAVDPYRCVVIGGSAQRAGRFAIGRFCSLTAAFGSFDLDLRTAAPSQDEITLTVWSATGRPWPTAKAILGSPCCECAGPASAGRSGWPRSDAPRPDLAPKHLT